jgi:hypothetical protein
LPFFYARVITIEITGKGKSPGNAGIFPAGEGDFHPVNVLYFAEDPKHAVKKIIIVVPTVVEGSRKIIR